MKIKSNVGNNPRLNVDSIWVGADIDLPISVAHCQSAVEMVTYFCNHFLNCDIDNIVWAAVNKNIDNGVSYSIDNGEKPWVNTGGGFIYTLVEEVSKKHSIDTQDGFGYHHANLIDASIINEIKAGFKKDVSDYTSWTRNEITEKHTSSAAVTHASAATMETETCEPIKQKLRNRLTSQPTSNPEAETVIEAESENQRLEKERFIESLKFTSSELANVIINQFGGWNDFKNDVPMAFGDGVLAVANLKDKATVAELFRNNQKMMIEQLVDLAKDLEYTDVPEMLGESNDLKGRYTKSDISLALFCYKASNHEDVAATAVWLITQMFSFDYESFLEKQAGL